MIKAEHLTKRYGRLTAVSDISFTVGDGEIVGFLGPNGAGKSTTMNMLTGYISSTSGSVEIDGHDLLRDTVAAKRSIGYLPEQPPLYNEMTVDEYLNFVYDLKGCTLNRKKHIEDVCNVTKIEDARRRVIKNLSKGYRQRIGVAQAIIGDPKTVILDEPTIGLDPKQIVEIRNLIRILGRDHAVILSTHVLSEVQAVCDRVIIINKGKLVADEKTENLSGAVGGVMRTRVTVCGPAPAVLSALRSLNGVIRVEQMAGSEPDATTFVVESETDVRRPMFRMLSERDWPLIGEQTLGADLENVFLALTAGERQAKKQMQKIKGE